MWFNILNRYKKEIVVKLASQVLRARSESFTESDASYASSSNDASETSSGETESTSESSATETNATTTTTAPSKQTITQVIVPRRIVIKYSANIEQPKVHPPIAVIGTQESESSDAGIHESSDFSDDEDEDDEEDTDEEVPTKDELTAADASEITTETKTQNVSDDDTECDEDDTESESEEDETDESEASDSHKKLNGYMNGVQSPTKGYVLDDFQLLKTIGEFNNKIRQQQI